MKTFFLSLIILIVMSMPSFAQDPPIPEARPDTSANLMRNMIGGFILYSTNDGASVTNAVGAGSLTTWNSKFKNINYTIVNNFHIASDSLEPTGGNEFVNNLTLRVPLDLVVPFMGVDNQVFVAGSIRARYQTGSTVVGRTSVAAGAGIGFKLANALGGDVITEYIYVPRWNDSNSEKEHRFSLEYYRSLQDNPKYVFFTGTEGTFGSFDPYKFDPTKQNFYNVKLKVGFAKLY